VGFEEKKDVKEKRSENLKKTKEGKVSLDLSVPSLLSILTMIGIAAVDDLHRG
jgi:hypothetical protein